MLPSELVLFCFVLFYCFMLYVSDFKLNITCLISLKERYPNLPKLPTSKIKKKTNVEEEINETLEYSWGIIERPILDDVNKKEMKSKSYSRTIHNVPEEDGRHVCRLGFKFETDSSTLYTEYEDGTNRTETHTDKYCNDNCGHSVSSTAIHKTLSKFKKCQHGVFACRIEKESRFYKGKWMKGQHPYKSVIKEPDTRHKCLKCRSDAIPFHSRKMKRIENKKKTQKAKNHVKGK